MVEISFSMMSILKLFNSTHQLKKEKLGDFSLNRCYNLDCLEGLDQLPNESVDTIITDCPFAIENGKPETLNYNRDSENVMEGYHEIALADYALFSNQWIQKAYSKLRKHGTLIIVSSWSNQRDILNAINENKFYLQNEIIWKYNFGLFTKRKFVSSHYKIFFCSKHKTSFIYERNNVYYFHVNLI